jgi:hypothetical protein
MEIIAMFSEIDDFCLEFEAEYNEKLLEMRRKRKK